MDAPTYLVVAVAALVTVGVLVRLVALAVVPVDRRPSSAMAWLLAIFFMPVAGAVAFLLIGDPKLPRSRRAKQRRIDDRIAARAAQLAPSPAEQGGPSWLPGVAHLNRRLGALPLVPGNSATLSSGYDETLRAMTREVDGASSWVHVEFYIVSLDDTTAPFFDSLEAAVRRGVRVRLLLDHIGSWRQPGYRRTLQRLDDAGVTWRLMLPVQPLRGHYQRPDLRNHRKLLVVDGVVAWTGSQNVVDRSYNKPRNLRHGLQWEDSMVRLTGPVVGEVNALFLGDWYSETDEVLTGEAGQIDTSPDSGEPAGSLACQVVPSGPGYPVENNLKLFNTLVYSAQRRVGVTSPYVIPDESLLYALTTAAERGLDVQMFVSERGDQAPAAHAQQSYYEPLLRSGVRIFRYPHPTVLHAKHLTIDDDVAVIGSSNMDMRSFVLNLEISLLVCGRSFTDEVRRMEDEYRRRSTELLLADWVNRPGRVKVLDNLARLTSALQ